MSQPISENQKAPDFKLKDQNEKSVSLDDLKGKKTVLYFYPKDDTPGCTKEACSFRDIWSEVEALDVHLYGISPDGAASHQKFIEKYNLPLNLLSDPDKEMMQAYGAYGEKMMYGKKSIGIIRSTVILDEDGKIIKHWKKVPNAQKHPEKVVEFLKSLN